MEHIGVPLYVDVFCCVWYSFAIHTHSGAYIIIFCVHDCDENADEFIQVLGTIVFGLPWKLLLPSYQLQAICEVNTKVTNLVENKS